MIIRSVCQFRAGNSAVNKRAYRVNAMVHLLAQRIGPEHNELGLELSGGGQNRILAWSDNWQYFNHAPGNLPSSQMSFITREI